MNLRFEVITTPLQIDENKIKYVINGFRALNKKSQEELLEETFEFTMNTSLNNEKDINSVVSIEKIVVQKFLKTYTF